MAVANTEIAVIDRIPVVIVERYDRFRSGEYWGRAHQEDLLQASGLPPERKYENQGGPNVRAVAQVIRRATRGDDGVRDFVSGLIFHWLTVSTDAHAKNYSLLLSGDAARLAPLYDLNSNLYYGDGAPRELSKRIGTEFRADRVAWSDWSALTPDAEVDEDWVADEIRRQATVLPDAFSDAARRLDGSTVVASELPQRLAGSVDRWTRSALAQIKLEPKPKTRKGATGV